jgi:hypothetical protein
MCLFLHMCARAFAISVRCAYPQPIRRCSVCLCVWPQLDSDVLCVEELEDFWTEFRPALAARGYEGVFVQRPTRPGKAFKHDGCVCVCVCV